MAYSITEQFPGLGIRRPAAVTRASLVRRGALTLLACSALAALPSSAHADEDTAAVWDAPFAVGGTLDLLPFMMSDLLVGVEVFPLRAVSFEIAGGAGASQSRIFLGMLHIQGAFSHWAPGIELGMSTGSFTWDPGAHSNGFITAFDSVGYSYDERIDNALVGRLGVSLGYRSKSHVQVRIHAGLAGIMNPGAAYCRNTSDGRILPDCTVDNLPTAQLYAGATVGYAFGL